MSIQENINELLNAALKPEILIIENDSAKHAGHQGSPGTGESHFSIYIESSMFEGVKPIERHKMIYAAIDSLFSKGLHAITITAKTVQ